MKKKNEIITDGVIATAEALTLMNPIFATTALFVYGVNRVIDLMYPDDIKKRIGKFEQKLVRKKIDIEKFKDKIGKICEHDRYVFSHNLNKILIDCIPETADIYISCLIDMIMNEPEKNKYEELCEIISQLNKNDLNVLIMINNYLDCGSRYYYKKNISDHKIIEEKNKRLDDEIKNNNKKIELYNLSYNLKKIKNNPFHKYYDRNIDIEKRTIFWKDFAETYKLKSPEMGLTLLYKVIDEQKNESDEWAFITRSFIKLESLGLLSFDYKSTLGTSNNLNIDRFHISIFGEMLLEYVKNDYMQG